jgi:hypothetical protein
MVLESFAYPSGRQDQRSLGYGNLLSLAQQIGSWSRLSTPCQSKGSLRHSFSGYVQSVSPLPVSKPRDARKFIPTIALSSRSL